jgi:hypothetical protein
LASADMSRRILYVSQFDDNCHFANLEVCASATETWTHTHRERESTNIVIPMCRNTHRRFALQSSIVQANGVRECLLPNDEKNIDHRSVADVLQRCNVVMTLLKKADYVPSDVEQDLARLLEGNTLQHNLRMSLHMQLQVQVHGFVC